MPPPHLTHDDKAALIELLWRTRASRVEDRRSHGPFEKGANPGVQRVEWQALPRGRRRFLDPRLLCPIGDSEAQFRIGADEIDGLVLGAEGRRAVLHSQFVVELDDVGERLCTEFCVFDWWRRRHFLAQASNELGPCESQLQRVR